MTQNAESLIVTCLVCKVAWDMDYDPPECQDPDHQHALAQTVTERNVSLRLLAQAMRANSERWFPQLHDGSVPLTQFYALGMAGEAGEVCNVVKKGWRKSRHDGEPLGGELADVFTYLLLLADETDVDLVAEYEAKVLINEARWGTQNDRSGAES
jgi:NTP pyrophosphatase (non-canonical NTP hydrolase)